MSADTAARMRLDARFMQRAVHAAVGGDPGPSPHGAALIVRGTRVIARAHRTNVASQHAALSALARAGKEARGATLYATLEAHGCVDAIVAAGIRRVVVGCDDPRVQRHISNGQLRARGIEVVTGVLVQRAEALIADFVKFQREGLPFVTLKAAVTLDGRTAARSGESKWITGPASRKEAHRMRVRCDAVLVGVGTVLADDPELTVRAVRGRNPLRVVLDTHLRTPLDAKLVTTAREVPTLILHAKSASTARAAKLRAAGVQLAVVRLRPGKKAGKSLDSEAALRVLAARDVVRLLVEGGAHVHAGLLDAGLVDRAAVFVAPRILADAAGIPMVASMTARTLQTAFALPEPEIIRCGNDVLFRGDLEDARSAGTTRGLSRTAGPRQTTKV